MFNSMFLNARKNSFLVSKNLFAQTTLLAGYITVPK